ncbi:tetratricopeptide repeat protein [Sphingomonas sp. CROZ-RG-20F-R02-07]|uniref:tetratricopeptide repeat protein n=1 Tax=Sphingomonas sp. CROZ-RG-20F-R02-07 TaxID=2914832 RepID=UPI001F56A5CE|nr:tetratricopeptide repeat protein [Sphingomonas sp. CROZ-RG-20F-R02-07]
MALPPKTNEAFLREVDDELRRDQLVGFWTRYGKLAIGLGVALLIALAGFFYWQHHEEQTAGVAGEQLQSAYDALSDGKKDVASSTLAPLAASGRPGYATLARFTQADLLLQNKNEKGAAAMFAAIADDSAAAKPFRDLALVRQTSAEYDTLKPQAVIDRLRPLAVPGNPWFGSAGEMVAVAYLRSGRRDLAGRMFGQIARDANVPQSIRQRSVQMAGVLGVDAVAQSEDVKAQ